MTEPTTCCRADGNFCDRCDLLLGLDGLRVIAVERRGRDALTVTLDPAAQITSLLQGLKSRSLPPRRALRAPAAVIIPALIVVLPLMAYNVFTTMDTTYFTGYPTIDNPYTDPVPNWANTKYMYVKIKSTGA